MKWNWSSRIRNRYGRLQTAKPTEQAPWAWAKVVLRPSYRGRSGRADLGEFLGDDLHVGEELLAGAAAHFLVGNAKDSAGVVRREEPRRPVGLERFAAVLG